MQKFYKLKATMELNFYKFENILTIFGCNLYKLQFFVGYFELQTFQFSIVLLEQNYLATECDLEEEVQNRVRQT